MKNFGFVIDNRKCIGCHACSTACKSENEVPLGVYRTWVKYVETGVFPDTRRHFQVTRCNHCANPPCVRICPVTAMYQREDGIVEFDPEVCIGCKACMQACPYDAIYIDPSSGTAAKCHYCAHRTDLGLEPACVVVCPEHAIIAGDMNDPGSEINRILATTDVVVRKPEQGTAPKLFYIDGNDYALHPTATERAPETFMWADVIPLHNASPSPKNGSNDREKRKDSQLGKKTKQSTSGTPLRSIQTQGKPWDGPIQIGARVAEHMIQVSYNAQHKIPWHWPVPTYLVTKGIGAGIFILLSLGFILNLFSFDSNTFLSGGFLSLLFIGITTGLLVYDLEKPERFIFIVTRPQWGSWLARGAFVLIGFTAVVGLWWLIEAGNLLGWIPAVFTEGIRPIAMWLGIVLAVGAAIYTAFLFGQAEGRDLWQSTLLPFHLILQAIMVGSGAMFIVDLFLEIPDSVRVVVIVFFIGSVILDFIVTMLGEFGMPHASDIAAEAAHKISHGNYRSYFWYGSIGLGHVVPLVLMVFSSPLSAALAGLAAMAGLYLYEYAFVMAPQEIPNS